MLFTVSMGPILVDSSSLNRKVLFIFSAYPLPLICSTLMHCALTFWQDITQATGWNILPGAKQSVPNSVVINIIHGHFKIKSTLNVEETWPSSIKAIFTKQT